MQMFNLRLPHSRKVYAEIIYVFKPPQPNLRTVGHLLSSTLLASPHGRMQKPKMYTTLVVLCPFFTASTALGALFTNPSSLNRPQNVTLLPLSSPFTVQCHLINLEPPTGLNPSMCELATQMACNKLENTPHDDLIRHKWIWTDELPGCALGLYLQQWPARPHAAVCERMFHGIIEECSIDSRFNAGTINVEVLPDWGHDGQPDWAEGTMWIMAPERLTL